MKLYNIILLTLIILLTPHSQDYKVVDDLGKSISFNEPPSRVISLAPNITEMIYQLNVQGKLVGNTKYCYFPEEAKEITKVGDLLTINYEKIIELNPDLIFITVEGNQKTAYDRLSNLGYKVFVSNPRDFSGIKKTFSDLGQIFDKQNFVLTKIAEWDSTFNLIENKSHDLLQQTIMIMVELEPIMVAGKNTFINSYIETCNMINFAEDLTLNYPVFSREAVVKRNPDIIVYPSSGIETTETLTETYPEWKELSAIKEGKVFFVDRDLYFRPGPRFIDALEDFYTRLTSK